MKLSSYRQNSALKPKTVFILLFLLYCIPSRAQNIQFLPEIDAHLTVTPNFRVYVEAKDDREGGDPIQSSFGPSIQFYLRPLIRLKRVTASDLDDAKSRPLVLETGYRVIKAPNSPTENRAVEAATFHLPLVVGILLSDRNRADLDWKSGNFTWRYRNKLTLERTVSIFSYHLIPYIAAEPFYESQYNKWSSTDLYGGCLFPVGRRTEFNFYYEHENDTGKRPNLQQNYFGLALYLFFSIDKE